jgi:hypothetical protein
MVAGVLADIFPETTPLVSVLVLGGSQVNSALSKVDGDKKGRLGDVLRHR